MLKELLARDEGKTLEFKENTSSLQKIIQTIVAFANTAGGTLVIGIKDKTKEIVGLDNILQEEECLANAMADSIAPQINPSLQIAYLETSRFTHCFCVTQLWPIFC